MQMIIKRKFNKYLPKKYYGHLQIDNNIMSKIILIISFYLIGKKDIYKKLILVKLQLGYI